jgi:hypothetical protein
MEPSFQAPRGNLLYRAKLKSPGLNMCITGTDRFFMALKLYLLSIILTRLGEHCHCCTGAVLQFVVLDPAEQKNK